MGSRASVGSRGKAPDGDPGAKPADALTIFDAETEFQCKLIYDTCSLDDDHVHMKMMMRPE